MKEIVPEMSKVRLVVTSEFEETVREYAKAGDDAPAYEQDRGEFGVAMGKVMRLSGDEIAVIIDSSVLLAGQEHGVPEQTFKHEAYHVALHQRGESLYDERDDDDEAGLAERQYFGMAAIACEESRVEMPLCRERPSPVYGWFPSLLESVESDVCRLSREYQDSDDGPDDVIAISRGFSKRFHSMVTACGYVAAVMEARECGLPDIDPRIDRRVFGEYGAEVIDRLRQLPPADQVADRADLETAAEDISELLMPWGSDIGFRWEDLLGDQSAFRVLKPAKWVL